MQKGSRKELKRLAERLDNGSLISRSALLAAYRLGVRDAADVAGGWTGDINTVRNCAVVSEVCREIRNSIRERC